MFGVFFIGYVGGIVVGWLYVCGYLNFLFLKEMYVEYLEKLVICAFARVLASFVSLNVDWGVWLNVEVSLIVFFVFLMVRVILICMSEVMCNVFVGNFSG